ncbi:hypothetical protein E4U19_004678 [Claviceps sp. Clav32 group G5]|nr:hypothetical protein E4U40_006765 [Claviceps sp. LM458 group G5]KAG6022893.1 hypothetical protein E4U19_004678 [Claviceps sp. Clav32 group G5]KAG6051830.1 hypothetical protein E4U39_006917 [Claviceps sp. Clav50 group G5]
MQLLTVLLASASIGFAVAAPEPKESAHPSLSWGWCNGGTPGNGDCEARGLHTYCCTGEKRDEFVIWRDLSAGDSENASNGFDCPDNGWVYCA